METYNDTDDLFDHTQAYVRLMRYYDHFDAAKCQICFTTLKKGAQLLIMSLTLNSIKLWKELYDKFWSDQDH